MAALAAGSADLRPCPIPRSEARHGATDVYGRLPLRVATWDRRRAAAGRRDEVVQGALQVEERGIVGPSGLGHVAPTLVSGSYDPPAAIIVDIAAT